MAMKWTEEQQKVITLRDRNILVSATAGSGKTAVLVQRILSKILDPLKPVDIDRLLIMTFTRAAAGEMRERIERALDTALGDKCGGNFRFLDSGIKDCSRCKVPHKKENFGYITGKYKELAELVRKQRENSTENVKKPY